MRSVTSDSELHFAVLFDRAGWVNPNKIRRLCIKSNDLFRHMKSLMFELGLSPLYLNLLASIININTIIIKRPTGRAV